MKLDAYIAGVGMTRFGRHADATLSSLARAAISQALADAGVGADRVEAAWAGTAAAPITTGQVCIAGQAILRGLGIGRIPVVNVQNACATASTAFHQAAAMVTLGAYEVVLAFGVDKLHHPDKRKAFAVFEGCVDVEHPEELRRFLGSEGVAGPPGESTRSIFMDVYARKASDYMLRSGAIAADFAAVAAKNSVHGNLNPNAQFRDVLTVDEVLRARSVVGPLTLPMCSPLADGAAAAIIVSSRAARSLGLRAPVRVRSAALASGSTNDEWESSATSLAALRAYELAGVGPEDLQVVELHDASSPAELSLYEALGLCAPGDGVRLVREGATRLGGRLPVNTSGGLVRNGHPIGATGLSQIHELTLQLRRAAGPRQVPGASMALAENGGGFLGGDSAAVVVSILERSTA